jgi:hypothetical protein
MCSRSKVVRWRVCLDCRLQPSSAHDSVRHEQLLMSPDGGVDGCCHCCGRRDASSCLLGRVCSSCPATCGVRDSGRQGSVATPCARAPGSQLPGLCRNGWQRPWLASLSTSIAYHCTHIHSGAMPVVLPTPTGSMTRAGGGGETEECCAIGVDRAGAWCSSRPARRPSTRCWPATRITCPVPFAALAHSLGKRPSYSSSRSRAFFLCCPRAS